MYIDADAAGSYLAGAAAALSTTTGIIGFVGAQQPLNDSFRSGYEAGARAIDPDIEILSTFFVQSGVFDVFSRYDEGAEAAQDLYRRGADVVFHAAGDSGDDIPQVATEMTASTGLQRWVIGVDSDQWLTVSADQQAHVLTSMLKRFDRELSVAVDRFFADDLPSGVLRLGIADGIVSLSESGGHLGREVTEQIAGLTDDLTTRDLVVPDVPSGPPTVLPPADDVIGVSTVGGECRVDAPESIRSGHSVRLDFANDADVIRIVTMTSGERPGAGDGNNARSLE